MRNPGRRLNQQLLSGAKAELAQRLAENAILGALAPCTLEIHLSTSAGFVVEKVHPKEELPELDVLF